MLKPRQNSVPLPELRPYNLNLAVVDIETASLNSHDLVQMVGILPLGGEPYTIDYFNTPRCKHISLMDKYLLGETKRHLEHYDGWIWWNGDRFDKAYLNDRLQMCGYEMLETRFPLDLMKAFKWPKSRTKGISLKWVAAQFGCPFVKVDMNVIEHMQARNQTIAYIATGKWELDNDKYKMLREHCIEDLKMTQWMFGPAKPRIRVISKNREA